MCSHSAPIANAERQVAMWRSVLFRMPAQPGEALSPKRGMFSAFIAFMRLLLRTGLLNSVLSNACQKIEVQQRGVAVRAAAQAKVQCVRVHCLTSNVVHARCSAGGGAAISPVKGQGEREHAHWTKRREHSPPQLCVAHQGILGQQARGVTNQGRSQRPPGRHRGEDRPQQPPSAAYDTARGACA